MRGMQRGAQLATTAAAGSSSSSSTSATSPTPVGIFAARRHVRLGNRLSACLSMLDLQHPGAIADIGYGSGYLLAELDALGHRSLVGVEKNPSLKDKAMYLSRHKWKGRPRWITGNGLSEFEPGEIQQAVMAGFGENQIVEIMTRDEAQVMACKRLVFCPAISTGILRPFLYFTNKWHIVEEEIVKEYDRWYTVLSVERGAEQNIKDDLDLFLGPFNVSRPHPFLPHYLEDCRQRHLKDWEHMADDPDRKRDLYCAFLRTVDKALVQPRFQLPSTPPRLSPLTSAIRRDTTKEEPLGQEPLYSSTDSADAATARAEPEHASVRE